jgi:hypothetical protein
MRDVLAEAESHHSIKAKMRYLVELFEHRLVGSGAYSQLGRGSQRRLRLELRIQGHDQASSLQQICDNNDLWIHRQFHEHRSRSRVDLRLVRSAIAQDANRNATSDPIWLSIGGVPKLLEAIAASFCFTTVSEGKVDDVAVWTATGEWKPERLAEFLPEQKESLLAGGKADFSKAPEQLPDRIVLHVGRDDLFPYRIEYWRTRPNAKAGQTAAATPIMLVEFYEVQFNESLDHRQFVIQPDDLKDAVDETEGFLQHHGLTMPSGAALRQSLPRR